MSLWRSPLLRRFRLHSYPLRVEALENRTLLSFLPPVSYPVGAFPSSGAMGDFNGDRHLDLAVANEGFSEGRIPGSVSVLLGDGDGTLQTAQSYAVGSDPVSVAVGDFNGDGHLDIVVANHGTYPSYSDTGVSVLLGNGDGTFQAAQDNAVSSGASYVAVADFDGDGKLDLALTSFYPVDMVNILLGNGDGTFHTGQSYPVGAFPSSVAVGDFNGDRHLDLAVANYSSGTVSVLPGNGDGTFQTTQDYAVGGNVLSVVVGDFDGDGHFDLAVANKGVSDYGIPGNVSVLLGNGDGIFRAPQSYTAGFGSDSVAVGDFDGDGHLDLVVANGYSPDSTVSILLGNGDGTFGAARSFAAGYGPSSVAVGDFNADGFPDLAVADYYGRTGDR